MPALTRRRNLEAPDECWHVFFGDVRVGTIAIRTWHAAWRRSLGMESSPPIPNRATPTESVTGQTVFHTLNTITG
jgi:hypothetical protein